MLKCGYIFLSRITSTNQHRFKTLLHVWKSEGESGKMRIKKKKAEIERRKKIVEIYIRNIALMHLVFSLSLPLVFENPFDKILPPWVVYA